MIGLELAAAGNGGGGGGQERVRKKFSGDTKAGTRLRTPDTIVERQIGCMRGKWDWFLSRSPPRSCGGLAFMFNAESIAIARCIRIYAKEITRCAFLTFAGFAYLP